MRGLGGKKDAETRGAGKCLDREYSCDLANSRDHRRGEEASLGSLYRTEPLQFNQKPRENVSEDSDVRGQDSRASTPVEKAQIRACFLTSGCQGKESAVAKDTRMLGSADDNGHD